MEKYGTIPPRFTKAWWRYFWDYYKVHTIATVVVLVLAGTTIHQCVNQTKYDLNISFFGAEVLTDETEQMMTGLLKDNIDEITDNENIDVFYCTYDFSSGEDNKNAEMAYAMQMKFAAEFDSGDCDIFIIPEEYKELVNDYTECFEDISAFVPSEISEDRILRDINGTAVGVSLAGNSFFEKAGIDSSKMYLCVRKLFDPKKDDEESIIKHDNSIKAASYIIGE